MVGMLQSQHHTSIFDIFWKSHIASMPSHNKELFGSKHCFINIGAHRKLKIKMEFKDQNLGFISGCAYRRVIGNTWAAEK